MNRSDLLDLATLAKQRFEDAQRVAHALHSACLEPDSPTANPEVMGALHILGLVEGARNSMQEVSRDLQALRSLINGETAL